MLNKSYFKGNSKKIKYMGVRIPKDLSKIYESNYGPTRWSKLPLDMHNRIETLKTNLLSRLLYLFQSLPVMVTPIQFKE